MANDEEYVTDHIAIPENRPSINILTYSTSKTRVVLYIYFIDLETRTDHSCTRYRVSCNISLRRRVNRYLCLFLPRYYRHVLRLYLETFT